MGLIRDSNYSISSTIVQFVTSLVASILIARVLGPAVKGEVYLILQFSFLFCSVISLGLGPSYLYNIRKNLIEIQDALRHALSFIALISILTILIYNLGYDVLLWITGKVLSDKLIFLTFIIGILQLTALMLGSILMSQDRGVQQRSIAIIISGIIYDIALLFFLFFIDGEIIHVLYANIFSIGIRLAFFLKIIIAKCKKCLSFNVHKQTPFLISFGLGAYFSNILMSSVFRVDTFIINSIVGPEQLGYYSVAVNLTMIMMSIPNAIGVALFPQLLKRSKKDKIETVIKVVKFCLIFSFTFSAILALAGYPLILILYGPNFIVSYIPLLILLPGMVALTAVYGFTNYYLSIGKPYFNVLVFGTSALINIIINILIIPKFGILGAAFASTISYFTIFFFYLRKFAKNSNFGLRKIMLPSLLDFKEYYKIIYNSIYSKSILKK